jgi:hypothetical protein
LRHRHFRAHRAAHLLHLARRRGWGPTARNANRFCIFLLCFFQNTLASRVVRMALRGSDYFLSQSHLVISVNVLQLWGPCGDTMTVITWAISSKW